MGELISFCFKGGIKNSLGSQGATWTCNHEKCRISLNKTLSKSAINYLLDSCNFILGSICLCQLTGMANQFNPQWYLTSLFCGKQKSGTFDGLIYFQKFIGLLMISAPSAMMNLKMITTIFILMSCNSRKKMKIFVKPHFQIFQQKPIIENIPLSCLIKETFLLQYQSHALSGQQCVI